MKLFDEFKPSKINNAILHELRKTAEQKSTNEVIEVSEKLKTEVNNVNTKLKGRFKSMVLTGSKNPQTKSKKRSNGAQMVVSGGGGAPSLSSPPELFVMSGADVLFMKSVRPTDREVSFALDFDGGGVLTKLTENVGAPCASKTGGCSIRARPSPVSAHTHPRGNRVSSADLLVSVKSHPVFGGERRMSMVVAPLGFYTYAPTPALLEKWKVTDPLVLGKLQKFMHWCGHQMQDETQMGDVKEHVEFVRSLGFRMSYHPYESIAPTDNIVIRMS